MAIVDQAILEFFSITRHVSALNQIQPYPHHFYGLPFSYPRIY